MSAGRFSFNAIRSVALGLLSILPAMVVPAILVRTLEPLEAAAWLYALSIGTYIGHLHLGIGPASSTLVARHGREPPVQVALLVAAGLSLLVAASLALAVLLGLDRAGAFDAPATRALGETRWHLVFLLAIAGTATLLPLHALSGYLQGIFRVDRLIPVNLLRHGSVTLLCAGAALLVGTVRSVGVAYLVAALSTLGFAVWLVLREWRSIASVNRAAVRAQFRGLFALAIPAALSGMAQIPLIGVHTVLIAKDVPDAVVAFSITLSLLGLISGLVWAVLSNLLPELSERFALDSGDRRRTGSIITRGTPLLGMGLLAIAVGVATGLPLLLQWVATARFSAEHASALSAYVAIMILREINLPKNLAMLAIGRQGLSLIPVYLEAALSLGLALVLVPAMGIAGLGIAVDDGAAREQHRAPDVAGAGRLPGSRDRSPVADQHLPGAAGGRRTGARADLTGAGLARPDVGGLACRPDPVNRSGRAGSLLVCRRPPAVRSATVGKIIRWMRERVAPLRR
ncbi:MAG: hypothetical protein R3E68_10085 [Burkholderiaceae bacterium]